MATTTESEYYAFDTIDLTFNPYTIEIEPANPDDVITLNTSANDNDKATMTQEQMNTSNSIVSGNVQAVKDAIKPVTDTISSVKDTAVNAVTSISDTLKIPVAAIAITGAFVGAYCILGIFANLKRNIKMVKE